MNNYLKTFLALTAVLGISLFASRTTHDLTPPPQRLLQTYSTNTIRISSIQTVCPANLDRTTLVVQEDFATATDQRSLVNQQIGIDGNLVFKNIVGGSTDVAMEQVTGNATNMGIFVGSFVIGALIFFLIWPFLCCCCTCPSCCPSKCCRKAQDEAYSKCELYWPAVTLIAALLLTLGASAYGFTKISSFGPSFKNMGCASAIWADNFLNGNTTVNGSQFFTGLNYYNNSIANLDSNLSSINSNYSDLRTTGAGSVSDTALTSIDTVRTQVKQIPAATTPFKLVLTYNTPIDASSTTLDSSFIPVLGDFSNSSTLVGNIYTMLDDIHTTITKMRTDAANLNTHFAAVNAEVVNMQTDITSVVNNINDIQSGLSGAVSLLRTAGDNGNLALQAFYGIFVAFSIFGILGAILTTCCDKYGCRHLMYLSCIFLFLAGLLGFIVVTLLSVLLPGFTWGCSFLQTSLGSQAGFTANFDKILGTKNAGYLKVCMPFGNGDLTSIISTGAAGHAISNLSSLATSFNKYNNTQLKNSLTGNLTTFMNTVGTWCRGQVVDLDSANFAILQDASNPSSASWTSCTAPFSTDSWVPSNSPNSSYSTIPCQVSNGNTGDATTCTGTLGDNGGNTCGGCMDSTQLETTVTTGSLLGSLNSRYSSGCTFNAKMNNIWNNYFIIKNAALGPNDVAGTGSGVLRRAYDSEAAIKLATAGGVFFSIDAVHTLIAGFNSSMSSINSLVDFKYGMVAGLNCRLWGQDFTRMYEVMCGSLYTNMYTVRLALGISCYGVLFAMCCIVCTGVRHYKHGERKSKVADSFFREAKSDETRVNLNSNRRR